MEYVKNPEVAGMVQQEKIKVNVHLHGLYIIAHNYKKCTHTLYTHHTHQRKYMTISYAYVSTQRNFSITPIYMWRIMAE